MTLQNICLMTIVEKFEIFFTAFSTTKDANLKRKFEFLQRVYSEEIAARLFDEYNLEERFTDFIVNKYLKNLDTNWLCKCPWKSVIAKMVEVGPTIKKINFHEYSEDKPWHEIICYLPNLEVLHFQRHCVDEVLMNVAEFCPDIEEIELRSSYAVTEEGFKSLCKLKNGKVSCSRLKNIVLDCCEVTEEAAKCLVKNLPSLEVFQYYPLPLVLYSMHQEDLAALEKVQPYKLTKLDFISALTLPHYADVLKVCFSLCPNLKTLTCPVFKSEHLDSIAELSNLENLHLEYHHQDELLDINDFLKLNGSKLTCLTLRRCVVSVSTLAENCPSLKKLHLLSVDIKYDDGPISRLFNLDTLTVELNKFGARETDLKSVCSILSSSPKIESMTFRKCDLTLSEIKTVILKCCEYSFIKKIDFSYSSVDKQFIMDILLTCPSLRSLNLDSCEFTSDDEEDIQRCAEILPNNPEVLFSEQLSFSDYDDIFSDLYDYDHFEFYDADYDDEYDPCFEGVYDDDYDEDEPDDYDD